MLQYFEITQLDAINGPQIISSIIHLLHSDSVLDCDSNVKCYIVRVRSSGVFENP